MAQSPANTFISRVYPFWASDGMQRTAIFDQGIIVGLVVVKKDKGCVAWGDKCGKNYKRL